MENILIDYKNVSGGSYLPDGSDTVSEEMNCIFFHGVDGHWEGVLAIDCAETWVPAAGQGHTHNPVYYMCKKPVGCGNRSFKII